MRFEWFFSLSIFVHVLLMIFVSLSMDMLEYEDVPIKARVNIRIDSPRIISEEKKENKSKDCLLYTSPSPRDGLLSRMPSSA